MIIFWTSVMFIVKDVKVTNDMLKIEKTVI